MRLLGSTMALVGFLLLWFSPYIGILTMVIGLGIVWSHEDQKIKKMNEIRLYEEENERIFERLKFDEPVSPQFFELSTLLFGTIKPHEAWLLEQLEELESMYSVEAMATIDEVQNISQGKFKNLFESAHKYKGICDFLSRDYSFEIYEDIKKSNYKAQLIENTNGEETNKAPNLNEILEDYDLEEWAKVLIKTGIDAQDDRNTIINLSLIHI